MSSPTTFIDYFDRIRIINLCGRDDRRSETVREFARHGWRIDGDRQAFFDAIEPSEACGFPNRAVRGCYLSHLAILEAALADSIRHVLVLEDDIAFVRRIETLGREAVGQLDAIEWDLAYFGHDLKGPPEGSAWKPVSGPMRHAHFYAVHARALPRLTIFLRKVLKRPAGHPDGGPMHYDGALSTFVAQNPDVRAVYFSRSLGYQRPSRTDLHPVSVLDRHRVLAPVRRLYRTLKRAYWHAIR